MSSHDDKSPRLIFDSLLMRAKSSIKSNFFQFSMIKKPKFTNSLPQKPLIFSARLGLACPNFYDSYPFRNHSSLSGLRILLTPPSGSLTLLKGKSWRHPCAEEHCHSETQTAFDVKKNLPCFDPDGSFPN